MSQSVFDRNESERRAGSILPVLLACVMAGAACDIKVDREGGLSVNLGAGRATDEWSRTYTILPDGQLEIVNVNGAIRVLAAAGPQVEVRAERELRLGNEEAARDMLGTLEMREEVAPDRVRIAAPQLPSGDERRLRLRVRYEVRVPANLRLRLETQNGDVELEQIAGRVIASSVNGSVTASALAGSLDASTVNGTIRAGFAALAGDSRLTTVNGGVRVTLGAGTGADIEANVVNGGINLDEALAFSGGEQTRQRVSGRVNGGGPRLVLQTTNGGVRIGANGSPGS